MGMWQQRMAAVTLAAAFVGGLAIATAQQKPAPATAKGASADGLLGTGQYQEQVEGKLEQAITTYKKVLAAPDASTSQKARAQLHIGLCYERLGLEEARKAYEVVLEKYANEQESASAARTRLAAMGPPAPVAAAGPVISQIWKTTEESYGRVSPDGRFVAGADKSTGDLLVRDIASGGVRRLTANPKDSLDRGDEVISPIWSPDGRSIAYLWSSNAPNQLWVADMATGSTRELKMTVPGGRFGRPLDWAPDGKSILTTVSLDPGGQGIGWVSLDGRFTLLTPSKEGVNSAAVSSDSKWVAYAVGSLYARPGDAPGVYLVPSAGGTPVMLASDAVADRVVGWSTGDQALVLVGGRHEALQRLVVLAMAGGTPVGEPKTVREVAGLDSLGMSRSGALLYASRTPQRIDVFTAPFDIASFTMTGPPTRVNEPTDFSNSSPAWSPDGRRLAWLSHEDNSAGIERNVKVRVAAIDEGTTTVIPAPFLSNTRWMNLLWSRDGRFILGRGYRYPESSAHRIDVTTGGAEVLMPENSPAMAAAEPGKRKPVALAISPDGQLIYKVVPNMLTPLAIVERRLSDGTEREIARNANWRYAGNIAISPDGSLLALRTSVATAPAGGLVFRLEVFPTAGGAGSVVPGTEGARINFHSWAPDNRTLLFTSLPNRAGTPPADVWRCSMDGGAPAKIGLSMPLLQEAVISPDRRRIAYTGGRPGSDEGVWMLENFLPPSKPVAKK